MQNIRRPGRGAMGKLPACHALGGMEDFRKGSQKIRAGHRTKPGNSDIEGKLPASFNAGPQNWRELPVT